MIPYWKCACFVIIVGLFYVTACKTQDEVSSAPLIDQTRKTLHLHTALAVDPTDSKINWIGKKAAGSHYGGFHRFEGVVRVNRNVVKSVEFVVHTSSIRSDHEKLTAHLKTDDFLSVLKFPRATFKSTSIVPDMDIADAYIVTGKMSIHGIQQVIKFPAKINVLANGIVAARAKFSLGRGAYGIAYKGKSSDPISDDVALDIEFVTKKKPVRVE